MKIWMIAPYPPQAGGVPAHAEALATALSKRHDVRVITYGRKGRNDEEGRVRITEIPVIDVPVLRGLSFFIGAVRKLRSLSKEGKADVIHAHYMHPPGTAAALYRTLFSKSERLVVTAHGSDVLSLGKGRFSRALVKWAAKRCDALICVSGHLAEEAERLGIQKRKLHIVRNGVDAKALPRESRDRLRKELCLPEGKIAAFSGKLSWAKGADIFMTLAEHLAWKDRNMSFLVVGSGPLEKRMRRAAQERGLSGRVIFAGGRGHAEAMRYVKASDVLVVPSRVEGFGLSALEAAALGVPVAALPAGALPEVLSPPSCTDNLPATVMKILGSTAFRKEAIERNRKKAGAFTLERMVRETEKTYGGKKERGTRRKPVKAS